MNCYSSPNSRPNFECTAIRRSIRPLVKYFLVELLRGFILESSPSSLNCELSRMKWLDFDVFVLFESKSILRQKSFHSIIRFTFYFNYFLFSFSISRIFLIVLHSLAFYLIITKLLFFVPLLWIALPVVSNKCFCNTLSNHHFSSCWFQ